MSYTRLIATLTVFLCASAALADSRSDLFTAARLGDAKRVADLLSTDPSLAHARNDAGETPMHQAAAGRHDAILQEFLRYEADVNAADRRGVTPLHVAASSDDVKLVRMLLDAGATINAVNASGETPLHVAARMARPNVLAALLASRSDVNARNASGQTPLHLLGIGARVHDEASQAQLDALANGLIAAGADPTLRDNDGNLAWPHAAPTPRDGDRQPSGYPPYDSGTGNIVSTLQNYETAYPSLCDAVPLPGTTVNGRTIWAIKITDNPGTEEDEPEFKYVGNMHGDETTGLVMLLNFIDELLTDYGTDPDITNFVNEIEIWIVPTMNPDGYMSGTRYNAHSVDLNRNFPEGTNGDPNTPAGHEPEVGIIMNWSFGQSFTLSANMHGGALVANYPFDNDGMGSVYSPTPYEDLFVYISEEYSQHNLPMWNGSWYHGITNGADWYSIDGGMQDWNYRYMGCNAITLEISDTKAPSYSQMPSYWSDNRDSMFAYMATCLIGVRGLVTDVNTGDPIAATVTVTGREHDIYTDPDVGDYHRMLMPGTYELNFAAAGYDPVTYSGVVVNSGDATRLDVQMGPSAQIAFPNGGETLDANVETDVTWLGNPTAQFHVQYSDNYGQSSSVTDDFEDGSLGPDYATGGNAVWFVTTADAHGGTRSARGGDIGDNQVTWMTRSVGAGKLSFWYRVSSEADYDWFNFYIDDNRQIHVAGNGSWQYYNTTLPAPGPYELKWEFDKDINTSSYDDTVYLDDLQLSDDQTTWQDIIALTAPGATSTPWTPAIPGTDYKARVRAHYGGGSYGDWDESDATFTVEVPLFNRGDMNCDTVIDGLDVVHFVQALIDPTGYDADHDGDPYPTCQRMLADVYIDGVVDDQDIAPFVNLLTGE
ncbi:MAG: M14 family zinc carboxypeptidase [Planctomycetota bacterium]